MVPCIFEKVDLFSKTENWKANELNINSVDYKEVPASWTSRKETEEIYVKLYLSGLGMTCEQQMVHAIRP